MTAGPEFAEVEKPFLDQLATMDWQIRAGDLETHLLRAVQHFARSCSSLNCAPPCARSISVTDGMVGRRAHLASRQRSGAHRLPEADGGEPGGHGAAPEGNRRRGRAGLGPGAVAEPSSTSTGTPREQHLHGDQPVPRRLARRLGQGVRRPGPRAVRERHPARGRRVQEPGTSEPIPRPSTSSGATPTSARLPARSMRTRARNGSSTRTSSSSPRATTRRAWARSAPSAEHYLEWKDTAPVPMAEVQAELGKDHLSSQEKLVAGMLRPGATARHRPPLHAVPAGRGRTIKIVCRYQQYRAVQHAVERLLNGKTRQRTASTTGAAASSGTPRDRARA